jgi:hypothetical protein
VSSYRVYFLDSGDHVASTDLIVCDTDGEAQARAHLLVVWLSTAAILAWRFGTAIGWCVGYGRAAERLGGFLRRMELFSGPRVSTIGPAGRIARSRQVDSPKAPHSVIPARGFPCRNLVGRTLA